MTAQCSVHFVLVVAAVFGSDGARIKRTGLVSRADDCPSNVKVDAKGDCVDEHNIVLDSKCCEKSILCKEQVQIQLSIVQERLQKYMGVCKVKQADLQANEDGNFVMKDNSNVCSDTCKDVPELAIDMATGSETLASDCGQEESFKGLSRMSNLVMTLDSAWKNCGASDTTTILPETGATDATTSSPEVDGGETDTSGPESEDAAGTQKWDYSTAKTAWDVLCHNRAAGVFHAKWKETGCFGFCHHLGFKCDPDVRVQKIEIYWSRFTKKAMTVEKTATPVTTEDGMSFRFFIESEGCHGGHGSSTEDCELPWAGFDQERQNTESVDITRRFLVYDARKAGARAVSIETNRYEASFDRSDVRVLGTGSPMPARPVYAGAFGAGCGKGLAECSKPAQGPAPAADTTEIDVTTAFVAELPGTPGHVTLMRNRNWAKTYQTDVKMFEWGN